MSSAASTGTNTLHDQAAASAAGNVCCLENGVILKILQIILMYHHANADLFVQLCSEDRREKSASATSSQHTCCVERYLAFVWFQTFRYLAAPLLWSHSSPSLWLSFLFIFFGGAISFHHLHPQLLKGLKSYPVDCISFAVWNVCCASMYIQCIQ